MKKIKTLDSGVTIILDPIEHAETVTIGLATRTGSVNENKKISGISHLIEHMMFKGTEKRSAADLASDVESLGAQSNAFTSKEITAYYIRALSENAREAAEILIDMFMNSAFDPTELAREKLVVCEEMKMVEDQPDEYVHDIIEELVFKGQPLGNSILGSATSVKGISRNAILGYIREQYTKDSVAVCITGGFDEDEMCEMFGDGLAPLKETKETVLAARPEYEPAYRMVSKDIEQSHIALGMRGVGMGDPLREALNVVNTALGGGMSSRLFRSIREEKGLAYAVYSGVSNSSCAGDLVIYAGVAHEKLEEAAAAIFDEIKKIGSEVLSGEELEKAKRQVKSNIVFGEENTVNRMVRNARNYLMLGKVYDVTEMMAAVDAVSDDKIAQVSAAVSDPSRYSGAIISRKTLDSRSFLRRLM